VGVPLITPVEALIANPAGKEGLIVKEVAVPPVSKGIFETEVLAQYVDEGEL
jgi:hypothetical protein